jgi:hypothetical protein
MGREWIFPLLVAGGLAIASCSSPAPTSSTLETPRPDPVGTAGAALHQTAEDTGMLHDPCGSSINVNCQRQVPSVDSAVDRMKHSQVKFKDGGFQMGKLHPAIKALIENAPEMVKYFQAASYSLIDKEGGFVLQSDGEVVGATIERNKIPVFQEVDYNQIAENLDPDADGVRKFDVMIGSGTWIFYDTRNSDKLTIGYDYRYNEKLTSGIDFPIKQEQGPISNVMLAGKYFEVSEVERIAQAKNIKIGTAYIISPVPGMQVWQKAIDDALDRGVLDKAVVVTSYIEQYRHPAELSLERTRPGEYIIADKYLLKRNTQKVDKDFPFGSNFFGPAGATKRHAENLIWWTEITRKK